MKKGRKQTSPPRRKKPGAMALQRLLRNVRAAGYVNGKANFKSVAQMVGLSTRQLSRVTKNSRMFNKTGGRPHTIPERILLFACQYRPPGASRGRGNKLTASEIQKTLVNLGFNATLKTIRGTLNAIHPSVQPKFQAARRRKQPSNLRVLNDHFYVWLLQLSVTDLRKLLEGKNGYSGGESARSSYRIVSTSDPDCGYLPSRMDNASNLSVEKCRREIIERGGSIWNPVL